MIMIIDQIFLYICISYNNSVDQRMKYDRNGIIYFINHGKRGEKQVWNSSSINGRKEQ